MRHGSTLRFLALCGLALAVHPARAQDGGGWALPDESRGARVAPILLLSRPEVRADLRLRPDQAADVDRVIADIFRKAAQVKGRTDAAAVELRRAVDDEQRLWLETKLTEDQVGRLGEIDLRWEGIAAITRPALAETLSLSDDQRARLARAVADRKAQRALPPERRRDPAAAERHFAQQAEAILNDGQRRKWERMLGRPVAAATAAAPGHATR